MCNKWYAQIVSKYSKKYIESSISMVKFASETMETLVERIAIRKTVTEGLGVGTKYKPDMTLNFAFISKELEVTLEN